ncbi:MAG: GxxExxY protein [Planctomycetes bacterium]|nr:GxxExxY protein [Planctomycetota bacterium]
MQEAEATHEPTLEADKTARAVIGMAIEVHRHLGPGLLESIYESALAFELSKAAVPFERQKRVPVNYKGTILGEYCPDLIVADLVVVEIKSVERMDPVFEAQLLTYLRVTGKELGLLLNFNTDLLRRGIKRLVLTQ